MITFTDKKKYLKGTAVVSLMNPSTMDILYQSDKFQTANVETSVNMNEIRAGLGAPIATIIPAEPNVNVNFTAADFSLLVKAMQTGASHGFGAPEMVCADITATAATLTIDAAVKGTPVAPMGYPDAIAYVQEVGAASSVSSDGLAYPVAATGAVNGFAATVGTTYKVWYYVQRANAEYAVLKTNFDPSVVRMHAEMAVYANATGKADNTGTRVGTLHVIVPYLKLGGNGGIQGDQTTADTTSTSGMAISYEQSVVTAGCEDCANVGSDLAYYLYVPCDTTSGIQGLVLLGGAISMAKSTSTQAKFRLVMQDNSLAAPDQAKMSYAVTGVSGVTAANGIITAGSTAGSGEIKATYTDGDLVLECEADLDVV